LFISKPILLKTGAGLSAVHFKQGTGFCIISDNTRFYKRPVSFCPPRGGPPTKKHHGYFSLTPQILFNERE
jgi:hypothetical protein